MWGEEQKETVTHSEPQQNKSIDMTELLKMNCAKKTARADANNIGCLNERHAYLERLPRVWEIFNSCVCERVSVSNWSSAADEIRFDVVVYVSALSILNII